MISIISCTRSFHFPTLFRGVYRTQFSPILYKRTFAMQAILSDKPEHTIVPFIASVCGVNLDIKKESEATPSLINGSTTVTGLKDIVSYIPTLSKGTKALLGSSKGDIELVNEWLNFYDEHLVKETPFEQTATEINSKLLTQSFLALPNTVSIVDYVFYFALYPHLVTIVDPSNYIHMFRWYNHIQHLPPVVNNQYHHELLPFDVNKKYSVKKVVPSTKKESKKQVAEPKKETPKPAKEPAKVEENLVSKLDIRVGKLVKVWPHPDSDKLYCEEVDVGEDTPRQIGSGIRPFHTQEEMENRMVCVLCNLKPRKLGGFPSNGMLLCACIDDHSKGSLINPPEGAKIGERVIFPGMEGEPATPAQVQKKKILEAILPDLKTNAEGVCTYKGVPFTTSAGIVTCEAFKDCHIS